MTKAVKTIRVLTSEGDTPGMGAVVRAVVRAAINKGLKVKDIMRGYAGLLEEEIMDMESTNVSDIINRGDTILYTARCKEFTTVEDQQKGADICRKHGIDGMVVIGGDGFFRSAGKLSPLGISTIDLPGTIDLDITCTDYTIGFDTAVSTAMEAIGKIHDTSTSHERRSIMEVMGRNTGYIALWCGIGSSTEDILLPEHYGGNEQTLIDRIVDNRRRGKRHSIVIDAERVGHSGSMAKRIETTTGIETGATVLGHIQRDEAPARKNRAYTSIMGVKTTGLLAACKSNYLVAYKHGEFVDFDIQEALSMTKSIPEEQYEIAKILIHQSDT